MKMPIALAAKRGAAWKELRQALWPTLFRGGAVLVHCAAGVRRAPVVAALVLACLTDKTFPEALEQVRRLRAMQWSYLRLGRGQPRHRRHLLGFLLVGLGVPSAVPAVLLST